MSLRWLAAPEGNMSVLTVSLFGYSYPLVAPHLRPDDSLLPFASLEDITAMKLAAITSRGSRKDFIDLWLLITRRHRRRDISTASDSGWIRGRALKDAPTFRFAASDGWAAFRIPNSEFALVPA